MAGVQPIYSGLTPGLVLTSDPLTEQVTILAANLQNLSNYAYAYSANGSQQTASNNVNTLSNRITVNADALATLTNTTATSFGVSNAVQVSLQSNVSMLVLAQRAAMDEVRSNSVQQASMINLLMRQTQWLRSNKINSMKPSPPYPTS